MLLRFKVSHLCWSLNTLLFFFPVAALEKTPGRILKPAFASQLCLFRQQSPSLPLLPPCLVELKKGRGACHVNSILPGYAKDFAVHCSFGSPTPDLFYAALLFALRRRILEVTRGRIFEVFAQNS